MIKLVLMDVDNTLLDFEKCAKQSIKDGFFEVGISFRDEMFDVFTEINNDLWHRVEKKELTKDELFKIRWKLIFEALNIDFDGPTFEKIFFSNLSQSIEQVDGATDILRYLSEKYTVCVASNARYDQQENRLQKSGMREYIDKIFVSEKIGFEKPDKAFFDVCFKHYPDIKKDEIIMIGDSLTADIAGGVACNIKTCWFNPKNKTADKIKPDYTVQRLDEIKNLL